MVLEEENYAPVTRLEIEDVINRNDNVGKHKIVDIILKCLNEKRDAYSGVVSSIKHLIGSQDEALVQQLKDNLICSITSCPMQYGGKMFIAKVVHRLSSEKPEFIAQIFEEIIETTHSWSVKFSDKKEILKLLITSLKAIRKAEQFKGVRLTNLTNEFIENLCDKAINQGDDATKLDTLVLILECRSSTKPLQNKDLISFETLFHDALSLQEPAQRQIFVSQTNKLLLRIRDSHKAVIRDKRNLEERDSLHQSYITFLSRLINFCFDSIYCNAYFGSFILTMSTLKLILKHITLEHDQLPIKSYYSERRCYDSVLSCLSDSFEENKSMALDLFFSLPSCRNSFVSRNIGELENIAYQLVESVNPAHALTCLYVFKLTIGLRVPENDTGQVKNQVLHDHLCRLMDLVDSGVEDTKKNFVSALKRNAIYPKLTCIRALLNEVSTEYLDIEREKWTRLAGQIVAVSIEACHAVSNVVCNLNPETIGHLPMDLKPVDIASLANALEVSTKISDDQIETVSSQMLLISGWKTIKECSLSMAALCSKMWWSKNNVEKKPPQLGLEPILIDQDIEKIINFFDHYLRNLRHRGAFEQAYNGFSIVASRIWREEELRSRLFSLLKQVMDDFRVEDSQVIDGKKKECLKAYVTRRSAGLPFIVQAILSAEDKHDSRALRYVMENLFEVLERPTSEVYQKIHCLNILRAVIKDYHLGEKVLSYVGKTLNITFDSFGSESFSIRNCASMLLKSTIDRIFGVNRLRDSIHRKNQMTYEKFFSLCPDLHSKMLDILRTCENNRTCLAAVHAVFIILFRLRPRVDFNPDKLIEPFLDPLLQIVYECPDLKLREIAAELTIQLHEDYATVLSRPKFSGRDEMIEEIKDIIYHSSPNCDRNRLHGALLLTRKWLEKMTFCSGDEISEIHTEFINFSRRSVREILLFIRPDVNCTIRLVALDIAELCNVIIPEQSEWFIHNYPRYKMLIQKKEGFSEPNYEAMIFKFTCNLLIAALHASSRSQTQEIANDIVRNMLKLISKLILATPDMLVGTNLQAGLIRLLRQLLNPTDKLVNKLMDSLDIDETAAFMTPFDKFKTMSADDMGKVRWKDYCNSSLISQFLKNNVADFCNIFNFKDFSEFKLNNQCDKFKARFSNTPRGVELLALTIECWEQLELEHNAIWQRLEEKTTDKIKYLTKFIGDLPDCDIKCLAIVCLAKLVKVQLKDFNRQKISVDEVECLNDFGRLLEDLCDCDHSYLVRDTCARAMQVYIDEVRVINRSIELRSFLISSLSTIIKLIQDEEHEIRSFCKYTLIASLAQENISKQGQLGTLLTYITTAVFEPNNESDICDCFTLMMRIVFDHSKNYSAELQEKGERLFDKTKLNTFADHIITIQSCFESLQSYLSKDSNRKIDLEKLTLTGNIVVQLSIIDTPISESQDGDYSWRNVKVMAQSNYEMSCLRLNPAMATNHKLIEVIMDNLDKSLDYFQDGYFNVLVDTEYNFHELSLFRRISFLKFIFRHVDNTLDCDNFCKRILDRLKKIVTERCATTLLCKCIETLEGKT